MCSNTCCNLWSELLQRDHVTGFPGYSSLCLLKRKIVSTLIYNNPHNNVVVQIKQTLKKAGADLVGVSNCKEYFPEYTTALSIGVSALKIYKLQRKDSLQALNEIMDFLNIQARQIFAEEGYGSWGSLFSQEEFSQSQNFTPHRELAVKAGLGIRGKNFLLLTPEYGPRLQLTTVLTTMPVLPDPLLDFNPCNHCTICVDACPTSALKDYFHEELCTKCYQCVLVCPVGEDFEEIIHYTELPSIWTQL
jgi:ferredoxin